MKRLLGLLALLALSACQTNFEATAPGAELPSNWGALCLDHDPYGRCTRWSATNGQVRPYDVPPPGYAGPVNPPRPTQP